MLLPCLKPLKAPPFSVLFMMLCISEPLSSSPNLPRTALLSVFPSLATQAFIQSSKNLNHIPSYPRPFSCTDIFIKVLFFLPFPTTLPSACCTCSCIYFLILYSTYSQSQLIYYWSVISLPVGLKVS